MRGSNLRPGPLVFEFWASWLALFSALAVLAMWCHGRYYVFFDRHPTKWVQDLDRYVWADPLFRAANELGGIGVVAGVAIGAIIVLAARGFFFEAATMLAAGVPRLAQLWLRDVVHRPMSFDNPPDPVEVYPGPNSFPSGHVVGEAVVYGLIFLYAPRVLRYEPLVWAVRAVCAAIIILGGPARMYTGSHWPSDVLGAYLLAALFVSAVWWLDNVIAWMREQSAEERQTADAVRVRALRDPALAREVEEPVRSR
ncbi:MAG: phosphatase PAP2 family protein [Dehalococcoidia bacterium]